MTLSTDINDLSSDDEIYGLNLPSAGSDDEEDQAAEEEQDEEEEYLSEDEDDVYPSSAPAAEPKGRFAKTANPSQDILSDASDVEEEQEEANSSDEEETWAAGSYHASRRAPGEADSSDDEALDLEAEEARRLQKKAKAVLAGEDYGLGEDEEEGEEQVEEVRKKARGKGRLEDGDGEKEEEAKQWTEEEAIAHLLKKSPETLALLDDFTATAERIKGVEKNLEIVRLGDEDGKEHPALAIMELEHRAFIFLLLWVSTSTDPLTSLAEALATYLPTLAFYFSLLLSPSPSSDLLSKVLARLSSLRQALATMEELDLTSAQYEDSDGSDEEADSEEEGMLASEMWDAGGADGSDEESQEIDEEDMRRLMEMEHNGDSEDDEEYDSEEEGEGEDSMLAGMTDEELEELMATMPADADADMFIKAVEQAQRQKAGLPSDGEDEEMDDDLPPSAFEDEMDDYEMNDIGGSSGAKSKKNLKKKAKRASKKELSIPDLPSSSRKIASLPSTTSTSINDDYLDPTSLSLTDSSDKASARHSLRFHVSQVKQKAAKRESGHGRRIGGDDDLPRRSKENARREVLKRQEHGAVGDGKGEALDGGDWNEEDKRVARGVKGISGGEEVSAEDYYDAVKAGREEGRAAKKAKYDEDRLEDRCVQLFFLLSLSFELADRRLFSLPPRSALSSLSPSPTFPHLLPSHPPPHLHHSQSNHLISHH